MAACGRDIQTNAASIRKFAGFGLSRASEIHHRCRAGIRVMKTRLLLLIFAIASCFTGESQAAQPWRPNTNLEVIVDIKEHTRIRRYTNATDMVDAAFTNTLTRTIEMRIVCGDAVVSDREIVWRMSPGETFGKPFQVLSGFGLQFKGVYWRFPDF